MRRQTRTRLILFFLAIVIVFTCWPLIEDILVSIFGSAESRTVHEAIRSSRPIAENTALCSSGKLDLMLIIISSGAHFLERQSIRETWASLERIHEVNSKHVFVVGYHENSGYYRDIMNEARRHRDILYLTASDNEPTKKELDAYRWTSKYCSKATYLFKTEDDLFVNTYLLHELIHELKTDTQRFQSRYLYNSSLDNLFLAHINPDAHTFLFGWAFQEGKPERNPKMAPYYVSYQEYAKDLYPRYCSGFGYLFDAKTLEAMLEEANKDKQPFRLADIYVSGMLPERLNFVCDLLPFSYNQGTTEECIDMIKKNNRKGSERSNSPLIVCSTGRHIAQNSYSDYYRMWTLLKFVYDDKLPPLNGTQEKE